jgi:hypothetical protein
MATHLLRLTVLSFAFLVSADLTRAQPRNLLQNPNADQGTQGWRTYGQATVETSGDNPCFVVRNGGYFIQDVSLSAEAIGQYSLLIARASTERVNADSAITGLPALYGYMMEPGQPNGGNVLDYLQGQEMLVMNMKKDEWINLWGIFQVPPGTGRIRFFLDQALRNGVPHNGSAARFQTVGLYLFPTKEDAQTFANGYH